MLLAQPGDSAALRTNTQTQELNGSPCRRLVSLNDATKATISVATVATPLIHIPSSEAPVQPVCKLYTHKHTHAFQLVCLMGVGWRSVGEQIHIRALIWSLKVFGLIWNSAGKKLLPALIDCLNHIIPPLCILMSVRQAGGV